MENTKIMRLRTQLELLDEWLRTQGKTPEQREKWKIVYRYPESIDHIRDKSTRYVIRDKLMVFRKYVEQTHGVRLA